MPDVRASLRARFGRSELAPLWAAVRSRLEQAGQAPVRRVRVEVSGVAERRAVAELLGLDRLPGARVTVALDRLDAVVGSAVPGADTRAVVEALTGPIEDLAAARASARREREHLWAWLDAHPQVAAEPALREWVAWLRRRGLVRGGVARTRALIEQALGVLAALPADGRPLPSFAEQVCAAPHALDEGTRLAAVVLRAVAATRSVPWPEGAEARRALWQEVGVACDELSTAVLVAGLRSPGGDALASTLRSWAAEGQAAWVTLAQLRAAPPVTVADPVVWVVENPSVVAEALSRFGPGCPPLVCVSGWPSSAGLRLLRALGSGGALLRYHGDLDGEGLRIAAHVVARTGAVPWGMTARDYRASVRAGGPPAGRVTDVPWDPDLGPALRERSLAVPEESVLPALLDAMAPSARPASAIVDARCLRPNSLLND